MFDSIYEVTAECETCFKAKERTFKVKPLLQLFRDGTLHGRWPELCNSRNERALLVEIRGNESTRCRRAGSLPTSLQRVWERATSLQRVSTSPTS